MNLVYEVDEEEKECDIVWLFMWTCCRLGIADIKMFPINSEIREAIDGTDV